jgi:DNA-binding NarL/FixJ family response regulator
VIRVLLVDDHEIVRQGLKLILSQTPDIQITGEAENSTTFLEAVRTADYDVVLLDVNMPGKSGIEVLKDVLEIKPSLPILVLTMYPEEVYAVRAIRSGASGYMTKASSPAELIEAVRRLAAGSRYITPSVAQRLASALQSGGDDTAHDRLSAREDAVLRMLATGKGIKQIGEELHLSVKTVSTYRHRILQKMGFRNNADIVQYAMRKNLCG